MRTSSREENEGLASHDLVLPPRSAGTAHLTKAMHRQLITRVMILCTCTAIECVREYVSLLE
jgi:hypothetical protein